MMKLRKKKMLSGAASRQELTGVTNSILSTMRIRRTLLPTIMNGKSTVWTRPFAAHTDRRARGLVCGVDDALFRLWLEHGSSGDEAPLSRCARARSSSAQRLSLFCRHRRLGGGRDKRRGHRARRSLAAYAARHGRAARL